MDTNICDLPDETEVICLHCEQTYTVGTAKAATFGGWEEEGIPCPVGGCDGLEWDLMPYKEWLECYPDRPGRPAKITIIELK